MRILELVIGGILARLLKLVALTGMRSNLNRVVDNFWIGGVNTSHIIISNRFSAVLDLRTNDDDQYRKSLEDYSITYKNVKIPDRQGALPQTLQEIVGWIADRATKEKILVHCNLGRGRAGLVAAAYLVYKGTEPEKALKEVRKVRRVTYLNNKQRESLQQFSDMMAFLRAHDTFKKSC